MKLRKVKKESNQKFDFIDRNLVTVTPDTSLANIASLMSDENYSFFTLPGRQNLQKSKTQPSYVLVQQGLELVGLITEQDLVKLAVQQRNLQATLARDVMTRQIVTLQETEAQEVFSLIHILRQHHIHHLPILNQRNEAVGMVTPRSIRGMLKPTQILQSLQSRPVAEMMQTEVCYGYPHTSVLELAKMMSCHQVSFIVIIQPHRTEQTPENPSLVPIAIVTERDIVRCQAQYMNLSELCAEMMMSSPLMVVSPTDSLWTAYQKMQQQHVQRLVVVNEAGICVGVISQTHILQQINSTPLQQTIQPLPHKMQPGVEDRVEEFKGIKSNLEKPQNSLGEKHQFATEVRSLHPSFNLEEMLSTTVAEVQTLLDTDRVLIYHIQPDGQGSVVAESVTHPQWSLVGKAVNDPCFVENWLESYRQGRVHIMENLATAELTACHIAFLKALQVQANLIVPIVLTPTVKEAPHLGQSHSPLWGLLIAQHCSSPRPWLITEIEFVQQFATYLANLIQKASSVEEFKTEFEHQKQLEIALKIAKNELNKPAPNYRVEPEKNLNQWGNQLQETSKYYSENDSEVCETLFLPLQENGGKIIATICMNGEGGDRQLIETQRADLRAKLHAFLDSATETQSLEQDIPETYQIQAQLKASQLLLAGVLNSSLDGIMAFKSLRDSTGKIVDFEWLFANPAACTLLGHSAETCMGKRLLEEVPGTVTEGLFDLYVKVVETGEPLEREFYSEFAQIKSWFQCIAVRLNDGFAVTFRDITRIKQSEQKLQQTNEQLQSRVAELKQRNQEMELLSEMSDFLLACLTVEEAYRTLKPILKALFPGCSGAVYRTNASNNLVEAFTNWGDELHGQIMFHPKQCWALRRGRVHWVNLQHTDLFCNHIDLKKPPAVSLCLPLIAQGETLGLLYLCSSSPHQLSDAKRQLARTVAEQISLAIANLKLRETLESQSIRDPLTGLFNRRYLEEALDQEIPRAKRSRYSIGIIMLDVDYFKHFNDTFGHEAGDVVLQEVGKLLKRSVRESDIACRYGGEEMTLILPEATVEETFFRAEQIRQAIKQLLLQYRSRHLGSISASFGVACFPKHGLTANEVIQAADTALYQAKAAGRNCVKVARIVDC